MIVCIYNRTLNFETLFGSHIFQRKVIITHFISVSVFEKGSDSMIRWKSSCFELLSFTKFLEM